MAWRDATLLGSPYEQQINEETGQWRHRRLVLTDKPPRDSLEDLLGRPGRLHVLDHDGPWTGGPAPS